VIKNLAEFDFAVSPVNHGLVRELHEGGFLATQRNAVLIGGTGTGKSHLSIAIGANCVDAAPRHPTKQAKGVVVRVKHHLLALARVGPQKRHAAVTKPDVGELDGRGHAAKHNDLARPVELIGLARRKPQRDKDRPVR